MRTKLLTLFAATTILLWQGSASAALNLILTKGNAGAIPIAIVPFAGSASAPQDISTIVQTDLTNSGRFNVTTPNGSNATAASPQTIDTAYWRKQNVDDVVVGSVESAGWGKYKVTYYLVSAYQGQSQNPAATQSANNVLATQTFTVDTKQMRQVAHQISDKIYQQLTGVRGVFSTKIAYVLVQKTPKQPTKYSLMVADADGYSPQTLLTSYQPIMSPTWAPDGRQLAYVSFENGEAQIFSQDLASGRRQIISSYPGMNNAPDFSPNGQRLALTLTLNGNPNIYVMGLGSKQLTQVTNSPSIDTEPSWSPDGQTLVFTSNRGGGPQIYKVSAAGGSAQRLTYNGPYNASPSFTPDGKSIIMLHLNQSQNQYGVAIQDLSTGVLTMLDPGDDQSPSLAPNGSMVIFSTLYNGQEDLGMVSVDGKVKLRIPGGNGDVQEPAWSPFLS